MRSVSAGSFRAFVIVWMALIVTPSLTAAEPANPDGVEVRDGVVMPRRPVTESLAAAMEFLRKGDGGYVPGSIEGDLAGYFTSARVKPDGTRSDRQQAFPGRHHGYFIRTFLHCYAYTGQHEWLLRARDLADWNLAHSTPADAVYANLSYSTFTNGKPGGNQDKDSIEPDKSAFLASGYLGVYEATGERKYLEAARKVAETLVRHQREDGGWSFRVVPETGVVMQEFGGAPVFLVEFFERMARHEDRPAYLRARDRALNYMLKTHVEKNAWGTYHEDVPPKDEAYLSAEPMSFTADYLFRNAVAHPEYVEMGRQVLRRMEEKLVHTQGHAAAPAPTVSEQLGYNHVMPGHTARYCLALARLYALTGDPEVRARALSGFNSVTYMQSPAGLFRTYFYDVNRKTDADIKQRPDWYSQHLFTVCHLLEAMPLLPELVSDGQDHIFAGPVFVRHVTYSPGRVRFETIAPSRTVLKLSFVPREVTIGDGKLRQLNAPPARGETGWFVDTGRKLVIIEHGAGQIEVLSSER